MGDQRSENSEIQKSRDVAPMLRVALLLGVLIHVLGFFIFRVVSNPLPSRSDNSAYIALLPADRGDGEVELVEQASLFDSAPLFIPGKWSSTSQVFPSEIALDFRVFPEFQLSKEELNAEFEPVRLSFRNTANIQQPSDLLNLRFWDLFDSFGEAGAPVAELGNGKSVAVIRILSGNDELSPSADFRYEVELETESFGLRPAIFYLAMSAPGLPMGAPLLAQSSGSDDLDAAILEWLQLPATFARLPAGYLEIQFFP